MSRKENPFSKYKKTDENNRPAHRPKTYFEKRSALNVMVDESLLERLREYCKDSGYTQTKIIRDLITDFLEEKGY